LSAKTISKSYSTRDLFHGVTLHLAQNERLGIIGPNGGGKSTLLKILAGLETPDQGELIKKRMLRLWYVPQESIFSKEVTPLEAVVQSVGGDLIEAEVTASISLSKLGFDRFDQPFGELSGGYQKRVAMACGLVHDPEVMLLDEPTNHLDLEAVEWLENFVLTANMSMLFVTHDRRFLENCASRILELAPSYPDGTFEVAGNYTEFVRRKEAFLMSQEAQESALANKVRRDTSWLRQGIQGRQTRNKTQVRDAASRRAELKSVTHRNLAPSKRAGINFDAVGRKTNKLLVMHSVEKSMGDHLLFNDLDLELTPARRIGLVGPNGSGKTTLLRLINGELEPDAGTIKRAENLRVVTSSQHRLNLDPSITLQDTLCPIGEMVNYMGRDIHVSAWADRFLFTREQLGTLVGSLSGGEQARIQIASLMLQPADILLLDEPTNDLDIPTLEVLEKALLDFPGAILLITHDRFMLDRIATEYLALDGMGHAKEFASFEMWQESLNQKPNSLQKLIVSRSIKSRTKSESVKLSYQLQREFDCMEQAIAAAEAEVERAEAIANDEQVMADHHKHTKACEDVASTHEKVRTLYDRWAELEAMHE
ncbi:MAG TPA: ABC-F family ATP-binding cassette domain-containing protein, partial [Phycisphaerales bacterium]|nr:ABC-F family ATP-binding cassette domain-containing protein [Phycisphaerales bacterium]